MIKALILAACLFLAGCATYQKTPAYNTAIAADVSGKYKDNHCAPFALDLYMRYKAQGVHVYLIYYTWTSTYASDEHAVVAYFDQGEWWVMDNMMEAPLRVKGATNTAQIAYKAQGYYDFKAKIKVYYVMEGIDGKSIEYKDI